MSVTFKISGDKSDSDPVIEAKLEVISGELVLKMRNPGESWQTILWIDEAGRLSRFPNAGKIDGLDANITGMVILDG